MCQTSLKIVLSSLYQLWNTFISEGTILFMILVLTNNLLMQTNTIPRSNDDKFVHQIARISALNKLESLR